MKELTKENLIERAMQIYSREGYVDIIKMANELGIDVYATEDSNENAKICYDDIQNKFIINVNDTQAFTRQRFSVAHELAHYILHREDIIREKEIARRDKTASDYDKREKEADDLAAELLVPKLALNEYIDELGVDKTSQLDENTVRKVAEKFKVSMTMVILRLRNLNYKIPYISFA